MNAESAAFNAFSSAIRQYILPACAQCVNSRSQQGPVTADELANSLKLPAASASPAPSLPNFSSGAPFMAGAPSALVGFQGAPIPMTSASAKKGGKKAGSQQPVAEHEQCSYVITRGHNKGSRCAGKKEPGTAFCTACKGKKAAQNQLQQGAPMPSAGSAPMPSFTGMPGMGSMMSNPMTASAAPKLNAKLVAPGLYRETVKGLAVKSGSTPNEFICCGIFMNETSTQVSPLTPEAIAYCNSIGLSYVDPAKGDQVVRSTNQITGQTLPNIPQALPGVPALPSLPGMQGNVATSGSGMFGALPGLGGMGFPMMPSLSETKHMDDPDDADVDDDDGDD